MALQKTKELVKKLPSKTKPHLEYIAALLTIPVLITAIILNLGNLQKKPASPTPTPSQSSPTVKVITVSSAPQPTSAPNCLPGIGQISIESPSEGDTVTTNPVCVNISYQSQNHCSVVWAYSINGGPLSDYSNNSVCLYNMPQGQVVYQLQVKSLVNGDIETIKRTFTYSGGPTSTPTPTPTTLPTAIPTPKPS